MYCIARRQGMKEQGMAVALVSSGESSTGRAIVCEELARCSGMREDGNRKAQTAALRCTG